MNRDMHQFLIVSVQAFQLADPDSSANATDEEWMDASAATTEALRAYNERVRLLVGPRLDRPNSRQATEVDG